MTNAKELISAVRSALSPEFRQGHRDIDLDPYVRPSCLPRELPLADLRRLLEEAMHRFADTPPASDAWLAPRLHACVRLTRAEAAERGLWAWLATSEHSDYTMWRWPGRGEEEDPTARGTAVKRFVGSDRDNAIARLWWGAELCRDGSDYEPVARAFLKQDVPNTWFALDAFHNRACTQAALKLLPEMEARPINRLATAMDQLLSTRRLDVIAPDRGPDPAATRDWIDGRSDIEDLLEDELPDGPEEAGVPSEQIVAIERLLKGVAEELELA